MEKHSYRNAIRSKRLIKEAFLQLISQKDISKVRIKEIAELADISKGTFYAHYQDIYSVLEEIEDENIQRFIGFFEDSPCISLLNDCKPFVSQVFLHMDENRESYELLFKSQAAYTFLSKLQNVFVEFMLQDKIMLSKLRNYDEAKMFFTFIAVGTANLIREIYTGKLTMSHEELVESLNVCILNGMNGIKLNP